MKDSGSWENLIKFDLLFSEHFSKQSAWPIFTRETMWNVDSPLTLLEPSVLDESKKSGFWKS